MLVNALVETLSVTPGFQNANPNTVTEWQEVPSVVHDSEEMSHRVGEAGQIQTYLLHNAVTCQAC